MCGICGQLTFKDIPGDHEFISRMCSTFVYRGPDEEGIYTGPHIGLGQRRLSIIDLDKRANPPLSNEDKTVWVVFNGEIYNFQDLRSELISKGHVFSSETDTEVIVHLYEEYGVECVLKMRGMFAFAVWDSKTKRLFAARDRLGKKPFCYSKTASSFIFGSEIKAIAQSPEVSISPNFTAIGSYLNYQYVPSPLTAFEGIYKLPPGHYLTCSVNGQLEVRKYWEPPEKEKLNIDKNEIQLEIVRLLRESVRLRMISDVPLGAFLSGGIDSGTIVALMAQESSLPVKTFSIGFEEDEYNELPYARLLASKYNTDHHEFIVKPDAMDLLPKLVRHYNEPFGDSSAIPSYYVSKMTRQHVTVALSGDGGDESFGGYGRYSNIMRWGKLDSVPSFVRTSLSRFGLSFLNMLPYNNKIARLQRGLTMLKSKTLERYWLDMAILKPQEQQQLYTDNFKALINNNLQYIDRFANYPWDAGMDSMDWMMRHDQNFYLPDCLMVKTDIASMANSLEVRSPLLDHNIVEFAASIPSDMKNDGSQGKLILKSAVKDLLPKELLNKPKTGFGVPLAKWFRGELSELLNDLLLSDKTTKRGFFDIKFTRKLVDEQISGQRDWSYRLWSLLFLELWFREFID